MTTRFADHLLTGTHAARPAAGDVPEGTLYACTSDDLIYQSNGASWSTWADVSGTGGAADPEDPFSFGYPFTADPGLANSGGATVAQNVCRYMRVIGGGAITKVGMHITTSNGNISVAHYSNSGSGRSSVPATRVATTGAIASPGTGYQEVNLSTTLSPGDWLAISTDSASFALLKAGGFAASASALAAGRAYAQTSAHPCPSPAGTLDAGNPILCILIGVP